MYNGKHVRRKHVAFFQTLRRTIVVLKDMTNYRLTRAADFKNYMS